MTLNATQIQGIQIQAIYQKIAKKLNTDSLQKIPVLKNTAENLKKNFLNNRDIFIKARKVWQSSPEFLEYKAQKTKINKVSIFEKVLSHVKPLQTAFKKHRDEKLRLLSCKLYELAENPDSLLAKLKKAADAKTKSLSLYKEANREKNKAFAVSIISDRIMQGKNLSQVKKSITKNLSEFNSQKTKDETKRAALETGLKLSNWTVDVEKAKKIVNRGRRTFMQFIKRIPKDVALKENQQKLQEAEKRFNLAPANKKIASLTEEINNLVQKIKDEKILQKYFKGIAKDIKIKANYEFAQEAGKNIQVR